MNMQISLAFHIIGILFWVSGLMVVSGLMRYFESNPDSKNTGAYKALTKKYWFGMVVPGLAIAAVSGLYQVFSMGLSYYMRQGWFHGKLTLVIILLVVTAIVGTSVSKVQKGESVPAKKFGMMHGVIGSILLLIVLLTYIGRA